MSPVNATDAGMAESTSKSDWQWRPGYFNPIIDAAGRRCRWARVRVVMR